MWFPYKGKPNQIKIDREERMTHIVMKFEHENQPIAFNKNILRNCSTESFFGNFNAQSSPFSVNSFTSHIEIFSHTDTSRRVTIAEEIVNKLVNKLIFWYLYFYGSKTNDDAGEGCILVSLEGEKLCYHAY